MLLVYLVVLLTTVAVPAQDLPDLAVADGFAMAVPHPEGRRGGSTVLLKDGSILLAYGKPSDIRSGPLGTVKLYGVVSTDGGKSWRDERLIEHNPACQTGRPSFLRTKDGAIWIFYYGFIHYSRDDKDSAAKAKSDLWAIRSTDEGKTWGQRRTIWSGYTGATNGAIQTRTGRIVVPFSFMIQDPMRLLSTVVYSDDNGETWRQSNSLDFHGAGGAGDHSGALEPAVVERKDGTLWMLIRTTRGRFWESLSRDDGATWSDARATDLVSTSAPAYITRLESGRLALVWNHGRPTVDTNKRGFITAHREGLYIALSDDDGKSWLDAVLAARAMEVSYPYLLEVSPGQLLISSGRLRAKGYETDTVTLLTTEDRLTK
jgi:hypothetical protein